MAFATNSTGSIIKLLALLVLAASAALARSVSDDHASSPIQSLPNPPTTTSSTKGSDSAKPEIVVDIGLCTIQCAASCLHKTSPIASPDKFRFGGLGKAICVAKCVIKCSIDNANVKPELYHCTLGCAYKSVAATTFSGSDAHGENNHLDTCYNKCQESFQG